MDLNLDEWEFLSDDGFLDFSKDGEKKTFLGKRNYDSKSAFDMDYFICPSPSSRKITEPPRNPRVPNQFVPVPIRLEPKFGKTPDDELAKEITTNPIEVSVVPSAASEKIRASHIGAEEADQDTVSQVFFKIKETESFVDMKMDSPKSGSRGMLPPIDTGTVIFDDKGEATEILISPRKKIEKEMLIAKQISTIDSDKEEDSTWEENNGGFNLWKMSFTGIGAICSFGVAAATICFLFFGSQQKNKLQQNQKIRFQIYADDKRIKQVVQHATKFNEAISAAAGVPLTTAHITYGGYYDGL